MAEKLPDEVRASCDAVGRLMEFWGFSRHMGRLWTLLYLSPEPLSGQEIQDMLKISAGTVSTIARQLQHWGVVHEVRKPGDRKAYYRAETDLWKMGSRVIAERERNRIKEAQRTFDDAAGTLKKSNSKISAFRKERIEKLAELCQTADSLIDLLVSDRMVDLAQIPDDIAN